MILKVEQKHYGTTEDCVNLKHIWIVKVADRDGYLIDEPTLYNGTDMEDAIRMGRILSLLLDIPLVVDPSYWDEESKSYVNLEEEEWNEN